MSRPITKLEYRFCKICQKSINFKEYRKVKPLTKGPKKRSCTRLDRYKWRLEGQMDCVPKCLEINFGILDSTHPKFAGAYLKLC